jgi:hypothetical protein
MMRVHDAAHHMSYVIYHTMRRSSLFCESTFTERECLGGHWITAGVESCIKSLNCVRMATLLSVAYIRAFTQGFLI